MDALTMFDEAYSIIQKNLPALGRERMSVRQARNRVLSVDAIANIDVPPFSRSMMDGYALHEADMGSGSTVLVTETTAAGDRASLPISAGRATRVMTGAPVPAGAAAVIRQEWCEEVGPSQIRVLRGVEKGSSIQHRGDDGSRGERLIRAGRHLTELDLAVLQTFGVSEVEVHQTWKAALVITGTELVADVNQELSEGQIYGTNDTLLKGALESDGIQVGDVVFVPDNLERLQHVLEEVATTHNLVLITGGVSVGDYDYTPSAVLQAGGTVHLRKLLMRPGSPLLFATRNQTAFFGLSGNPAACFAQFSVLVRPALRTVMGEPDEPFPYSGILTDAVSLKPIKHTRVERARAQFVDGQLMVNRNLTQSTGVISSLAQTDVYIRLDEPEYRAGAVVPMRFVRSPMQAPSS